MSVLNLRAWASKMLLTIVTVFSLQLMTCSGFQWSDRLQVQGDGTEPVELTLCSGGNIQLFWNYTLAKGERVTGMEWTCQPAGKTTPELLATYVAEAMPEKGGNFVPTAPFSGRVLQLTGGGLEVSCATISESGTYRIAVTTVHDVTHVTNVHRNTAKVKVVDPPKTRSGQLEIRQNSEAVQDTATGQWHVQLRCGNFSDIGHPAVDVLWKTPADGAPSPSSSFDSSAGDFTLNLPNPVKGGRYSCALAMPHAPAAAEGVGGGEAPDASRRFCLKSDSALLQEAALDVDGTDVRLSLLEARHTALQELVQVEDRRLVSYVGNVTDALTERIDEDHAALSKPVAFHARLANDLKLTSNDDISFTRVSLNQGGGYDPATGRFTAPANGTYFFVGTTAPKAGEGVSRLLIIKKGETNPVATAFVHRDRNTQTSAMATCCATLYLVVGDQVLLRGEISLDQRSYQSYSSFSSHVTSFSGFRV